MSGLKLGPPRCRACSRGTRVSRRPLGGFFFVYLWLGMLAVDVSGASAFILSALLGGAIYLFIWAGLGDGRARRSA